MKKINIILLLLAVLVCFFAVRSYIYNGLYKLNYKEYITEYSTKYGVNPYLVMAVINTESRYNKDAVSPQGATGLMQITGPTADWIAKKTGDADYKKSDLYDPETNIKMGVWYLNNLMEEFGAIELSLAAYNAGRGNVADWLKDTNVSSDGKTLKNIPFAETDNYIRKVVSAERIYRFLYPKLD